MLVDTPSKTVVQSGCCRRKRLTEAVYSCLFHLMVVPTGGSSKRLFCFHSDSDTMRYVGGGVLNNPATRASQSRGGGRSPRAGWLMKSGIVRRDGMAPGVKRQAQSETAVLTRLGCALLKQSPRVRNDSNQRVVRPNQRRSGVDQWSTETPDYLVQRRAICWQADPGSSSQLSDALPGVSRTSANRQGLQGLDVTSAVLC